MNNLPINVVKKVPNIPHWRWVVLSGEGITPEINQLKAAADDEGVDLLSCIDQDSESYDKALEIRDEIPVRSTVQDMLMEKCHLSDIANVVYHKFKIDVSKEDLEVYRDLFFDTKNLDNFKIAEYFEGLTTTVGEYRYQPPPVPGEWRDQYAIYENGGIPDIDPEAAIKFLFSESVFKSSEMNNMGWHGHNNKIRYSRLALEIYKELTSGKGGGINNLPDNLKTEITYPDSTSIDVSEVDDYDKFDDPNKIEEREDE